MSKFKVWIDDNNVSTNCQTSDVFADDNQRKSGFKSGTGASAIRVNTALRQANLIAVALVNALGVSDDFDVTSSLEDMTNWFSSTNLFKLSDLFTFNSTKVTLNKNIEPASNGNIDLGSSTMRFDDIYAQAFRGALYGSVSGEINGIYFNLSDNLRMRKSGEGSYAHVVQVVETIKDNIAVTVERRNDRITTATDITWSKNYASIKVYASLYVGNNVDSYLVFHCENRYHGYSSMLGTTCHLIDKSEDVMFAMCSLLIGKNGAVSYRDYIVGEGTGPYADKIVITKVEGIL